MVEDIKYKNMEKQNIRKEIIVKGTERTIRGEVIVTIVSDITFIGVPLHTVEVFIEDKLWKRIEPETDSLFLKKLERLLHSTKEYMVNLSNEKEKTFVEKVTELLNNFN